MVGARGGGGPKKSCACKKMENRWWRMGKIGGREMVEFGG